MKQFAFNVWLENKLIDTVFYSVNPRETIAGAVETVRDSLINHDGYSPGIRVTWPKDQRRTVDSFEVRGDYGYGHGLETLCAESTRKEARQRLREYRENDHTVSRLCIVCVREKGE